MSPDAYVGIDTLSIGVRRFSFVVLKILVFINTCR